MPGVYLLADSTAGNAGNMVVLVGADGPLIVGPQAPSLVAQAHALLRALGAGHARYVLVTAGERALDSAIEHADGGWGREGALTIAHEGIRSRIRSNESSSR